MRWYNKVTVLFIPMFWCKFGTTSGGGDRKKKNVSLSYPQLTLCCSGQGTRIVPTQLIFRSRQGFMCTNSHTVSNANGHKRAHPAFTFPIMCTSLQYSKTAYIKTNHYYSHRLFLWFKVALITLMQESIFLISLVLIVFFFVCLFFHAKKMDISDSWSLLKIESARCTGKRSKEAATFMTSRPSLPSYTTENVPS